MDEKLCTLCGQVLPLDRFHRDSLRRCGRRSRCAVCISRLTAEDSKKPPVVDPGVTHKNCPRCERLGRDHVHPVESFGVARRKKDGRNSWCRACCREASLAWQQTETGRKKHIEAVKRYNKRKRERARSSGA